MNKLNETVPKKKTSSNYSFLLILITGIVAGSIVGLVFGEKAMILKPFGDVFINLLFTLVVPLVFTTISSSISSMSNMKRLGKILGSLFTVFIGTGIVAAVIILFIVNVFPPAKGVNLGVIQGEALKESATFSQQIVKALTVGDFPELISRKNMLPLIVFSIFFGFSINLVGEKGKIISNGLDALAEIFLKMINLLMYYAPIGLGAYFATTIGEFGPQLLKSYARAMIIYYPLCIAYFFIAFPIYGYIAGGIEGIRRLKYLFAPAVTALATQSSLATLPINLESAEKIGVPKDIREIVLPFGATAHMDGTVISTILKISFLFGIYNLDFTGAGTYATAILLAVAGGVVMSGVPGGGLIGEMLIVTMYGFPNPEEAFAIIAVIGYLVDPPATMINASGDTVAAMIVTRMVEGKEWMKQKMV
ncbi:dicarboxylate/amino acid:cation symporter [Fusobacterium sp. PH5-44]|uniref:dicarboxylate/amino acid:cation symporter n=1 Tax=unclassified Fusobacterium TaxID=2648384 RepID=UPI003D25DCB2